MTFQALEQEIQQRLQPLAPQQLQVTDDSAHHIGHAEAKPGRYHITLHIRSAAFQNCNQLQIQRMLYHALGDLLEYKIHAIQFNAGPNIS